MEDIVKADKRAGDVIRRLRVLMKKGEHQFAPVNLNDLLREVLEFTHTDCVKRNVAVTVSFGTGLPPAQAAHPQSPAAASSAPPP